MKWIKIFSMCSQILKYYHIVFVNSLKSLSTDCTLLHSLYFRQGKTLHIVGLYYLLKILHKDCYMLA